MNDFTASNGIIVAFVGSSQRWTVDPLADGGDYANVTEAQMQALREFFQAEADERLGRWRWPENPDYVVFVRERTATPNEKRRVRVIHELDGDFMDTGEGSTLVGAFKDAARAYFDAHPEPKPEWHDAIRGEVWEIVTVDHEAALYVVENTEQRFIHVERRLLALAIDDQGIVSGRRIWKPKS